MLSRFRFGRCVPKTIGAETRRCLLLQGGSFNLWLKCRIYWRSRIRDFREGSIVKGRVLEIRPREVLVDIGYKSEGVIPSAEFDDIDSLEVGDEVEVLLERLENDEGMVVLSKEKAAYQQNWNKIASVFQGDGLIKGKVKAVVKGGLMVNIGVEAFLPGVADRHHSAERSAAVRRQHLRFQDRQDQ